MSTPMNTPAATPAHRKGSSGLLPYLKAVTGTLVPLAVTLGYALHEASEGKGGVITGSEWVMILAAAGITGGGVFGVPNKDPKGKKQDQSVQPPDRT